MDNELREVLMPVTIFGSFGTALYFFARVMTDYILKKKMIDKEFHKLNETAVKSIPTDIKIILVGIQKKIQNLHSDSVNSGFLQQLLNEAGQLIGTWDKEAGAKIQEYSDELNFYLDGGEDNLVKFYRCKGETLAIIAKKTS